MLIVITLGEILHLYDPNVAFDERKMMARRTEQNLKTAASR